MKDPKPMFAGGATDLEKRWLSEAREEEPPPEVVRRIERALGISAGPLAAPAPSRAQAAASAGKGGLTALRLASLVALGVGGAVGLVLLLSRTSPSTAPAAKATPELNAVVTAPPPAPGPVPVNDSTPAGASQVAPVAASPAGALRDEITLIDEARAALTAGSPARALALLERYRARHVHGVLLPEALAMRIEAIDRSGEHERARVLARSFIAENPNSPLAQRLAQLAAPDRK